MNLPVEVFIVAAGVIGAAIGFAGHAFFCGAKRRRISKEAWDAARIYYTRRYEEQGRRI